MVFSVRPIKFFIHGFRSPKFYTTSPVIMNKNPETLFTESSISSSYINFRPNYPGMLATKIKNYRLKSESSFKTMVDVGCGSGQSTLMWADDFSSILGIDISQSQIENAPRQFPNINFQVSDAYNIPVKDSSIDLVTTAQTMHWLDKQSFYTEVNRVLKASGVLAVYGYGNVELSDSTASTIIKEVNLDTVPAVISQ